MRPKLTGPTVLIPLTPQRRTPPTLTTNLTGITTFHVPNLQADSQGRSAREDAYHLVTSHQSGFGFKLCAASLTANRFSPSTGALVESGKQNRSSCPSSTRLIATRIDTHCGFADYPPALPPPRLMGRGGPGDATKALDRQFNTATSTCLGIGG